MPLYFLQILQKILHFFPPFRGKFRLVRLICTRYLAQKTDFKIAGCFGINYKVPNATEIIGFELFTNGVYELEYIKLISKSIPLNGTLLDLGANIGAICLPLSKLRPDITIIAVEASPRVFSYLEYNIAQNNSANIIAINKALSTQNDQWVSFYSPIGLFGKGSLSPIYTQEAESVQTITLDTLVTELKKPQIDFIKIDVEGYEHAVLSGGAQLLSREKGPTILFEFSAEMESMVKHSQAGDSQRFLRSSGYQLTDVTKPNKPMPIAGILTSGTKMIVAQKSPTA